MEATAKSFQVGDEFEQGHGCVKRYRFPQLADPCVFNDREYKFASFAFGGDKEEAIRYFCRVCGFGLGPYQIRGVVWDCLIVYGLLGWLGELDAIAKLLVVLV